MKVRYELLSMSELRGEDPRGLFVGSFIASPTDQVEELTVPTTTVDLGVEDFGDFVLRFSVDFNRRRRWLNPAGDGVRSCGLELRDMEDRMDCAHGVRKTEGVGVCSGPSDDFVGTQELFGEFLGGTGGPDVLCSDIGLVSDLEVRSRETVFVCLDLVPGLRLSDVRPECRMEFVEVDGEFASASGGDVSFRVDGKSGMVTLVREEG